MHLTPCAFNPFLFGTGGGGAHARVRKSATVKENKSKRRSGNHPPTPDSSSGGAGQSTEEFPPEDVNVLTSVSMPYRPVPRGEEWVEVWGGEEGSPPWGNASYKNFSHLSSLPPRSACTA